MDLEFLRSAEAYQAFRNAVPNHRLGYRFQPHRHFERTKEGGLPLGHRFVILDLNTSYPQMLANREKIEDNFIDLSIWGYSQPARRRDGTVSQAFEFYEEHPELYKSVLLLTFPGIRGWFLSRKGPLQDVESAMPFNHPKRPLPPSFIASEVTLMPEDFSQARGELSKSQDMLSGRYHTPLEKCLDKLLFRRFFKTAIDYFQGPPKVVLEPI